MWPRIFELMFACWLALSPFIFHYSAKDQFLWHNDYACAFLIAVFALCSFWHLLRKLHLLSLGVAGWLLTVGYRTFPLPATIPEENYTAIGILLFMFAIIPTYPYFLSYSWQKFMKK